MAPASARGIRCSRADPRDGDLACDWRTTPFLDDELRAIADQVISFCEKEVRPGGEAWER